MCWAQRLSWWNLRADIKPNHHPWAQGPRTIHTEDGSSWALCRGRIKASRIENSHRYCIFSRKKFQFNKFMQHIVSHTEAVPKQGQQAPRLLLLLVPEGSLAFHKASHNERLTASIASNNLWITIICDHSKLPEYSIFLTIVKNNLSFANLSKLLPRISKVLCFPPAFSASLHVNT